MQALFFFNKLHAGKLHGRNKVTGAKLEVFWGLRAALAKPQTNAPLSVKKPVSTLRK